MERQSELLNRFVSFDIDAGVITAQADVTIGEILQVTIPKGWCLPVIPDDFSMPIAEALTQNVKGTNHYRVGGFRECVLNCQMYTLPEEAVEQVESLSMQLMPIHSAWMEIEAQTVPSLFEMTERMRKLSDAHAYVCGVVDPFADMELLGCGVVQTADHYPRTENDQSIESYARSLEETQRRLPWLQRLTLRPRHMEWHSRLHSKTELTPHGKRPVHLNQYFQHYISREQCALLYGPQGYSVYQCMIPDQDEAAGTLHELLVMIRSGGVCAHRIQLCRFREDGDIKAGFGFRMIFPANEATRTVQRQLNDWMVKIGGKVDMSSTIAQEDELMEMMHADRLSEAA